MRRWTMAVLLGWGLTACRSTAPAAASTTGGFTSDSVRRGQLERFRTGLAPATALTGGAPSRDSLVRAFLQGLEARDTAALRDLQLSRAEWGWLYYPTNPESRPPYDLDPQTMWFTTSQQGAKGLARALENLGGKHLVYAGHRCEGTPSRQGENLLYGPCLVATIQPAGDTVEGRLFGLVIERGGRFKFVNYANKLD